MGGFVAGSPLLCGTWRGGDIRPSGFGVGCGGSLSLCADVVNGVGGPPRCLETGEPCLRARGHRGDPREQGAVGGAPVNGGRPGGPRSPLRMGGHGGEAPMNGGRPRGPRSPQRVRGHGGGPRSPCEWGETEGTPQPPENGRTWGGSPYEWGDTKGTLQPRRAGGCGGVPLPVLPGAAGAGSAESHMKRLWAALAAM